MNHLLKRENMNNRKCLEFITNLGHNFCIEGEPGQCLKTFVDCIQNANDYNYPENADIIPHFLYKVSRFCKLIMQPTKEYVIHMLSRNNFETQTPSHYGSKSVFLSRNFEQLKDLAYSFDVKVFSLKDKVVSFVYKKGSEPYTKRIVLVSDVKLVGSQFYLMGTDLNKEGYRRYNNSQIKDGVLTLLPSKEVVYTYQITA